MTHQPYIVYLDQNKWVELARAEKWPDLYPDLYNLLKLIKREVDADRLILPLTSTNIYETFKVNDPQRRQDLATLQAFGSQGLVIRGRHHRLEAEISDFLHTVDSRPPIERVPLWFLSSVFFEAYADWDDPRLATLPITARGVNAVRSSPEFCLYDFLTATPDNVRVEAIQNFSRQSEELKQQIEERRRRDTNESIDMRRRIQNALLIMNDHNLILSFARKCGFTWNTIVEMGEENILQIVESVPTYYVERELVLKLETQSRSITENDFRDIQSFCASIPYVDEIIGENQFTNLARQARLDKKFSTRLRTNVLDLVESLTKLDVQ